MAIAGMIILISHKINMIITTGYGKDAYFN